MQIQEEWKFSFDFIYLTSWRTKNHFCSLRVTGRFSVEIVEVLICIWSGNMRSQTPGLGIRLGAC